MMDVCKSWNDQIRGLNGLFADIAFDTHNPITISTATKFLELIEAQSNNLRVYARCIIWDGDPTQQAFISRLRLQSWRFVRFEVDRATTTVPFIAQFNLPAPRLLRLIHTPALPEGLFASSFTSLRVLDGSVEKHFPWPTATFSNLVTLRLQNSRPTRRFCATSLLDLIGHAKHLEELQLTDFLRFSGGRKANPLPHASLRSIHLIQSNLQFILQNLLFPNATSLRVESYGIDAAGESDLPASRDIGYFSSLRACSVPILEHRFTKVIVQMQDLFTSSFYLTLGIECEASRTVNFTVAFQKEGPWEAYVQSSINGILQRIRLGARVELSVFHHLPLSPKSPLLCRGEIPFTSIDSPFLQLPQVVTLRTDLPLVRGVMHHLADLEHMILPNLKCYSFDLESLPAFVDPPSPEAVVCLRSRFANGSPFAIQYWALDGETQRDEILRTCADARRSVDDNTMDIMTVLVKESLPALVTFLRGMNDGFVGEGGYALGDLYVERWKL
jgi:hypothetical protein